LCMGLLAQEWASGTIETLMTAPVAETDVVIGKFFGSLAFVSGYLGIILVGALFIAVALFCSSLTRSQVVAAALAAAILFAVTIVPYYVAGRASLSGFWRGVADQAVFRRYMDFSKGVIDTSNI